MSQGELDEGVVDAPIGIGDIEPSYGQGALVLSSRFDECC